MTRIVRAEPDPDLRTSPWRVAAIGVAIVLVCAGALFAVLQVAAEERRRDLRAWQTRMGIVADSRVAAIADWLAAESGEMRALAENPATSLYLGEITLLGDMSEEIGEPLAEAGFLEHLLKVTAQRSGYVADAAEPAGRSPAFGLLLIDSKGRIVASTPDPAALDDGRMGQILKATDPGGRMIDLHIGASGRPTMVFSAPVHGVQDDPDIDAPIGHVLGIKAVDGALYPLLRQPGTVEKTAEAVLLRSAGAAVEYLSPLADGQAPLALKLARDTVDLAAAFAVASPGGFAVQRDYRDHEVLVISRAVPGAAWTLMYKVDRAEALRETDARLWRIIIIGGLLAIAVIVGIIAAWRHGSSRRSAAAAARYRDLAWRHEAQERLLTLVSDSQSEAIYLLDGQDTIRFANAAAARLAGLDKDATVGKSLAAVLGPYQARRLADAMSATCTHGRGQTVLHRDDAAGGPQVIETDILPVDRPDRPSRDVLLVRRDVSAVTTARERREQAMQQLVATLCGLVDRRNPYAANHSARVAQVGQAIATDLGLDPAQVETVRVAGSLMNLGKIFVPEPLLTKTDVLSDEERDRIRASILLSADIVADVDLDGPVVQTLRQMQEHWDGSGYPSRLAGEAILVSARICAVANAFVGMVSARAWRDAMSFDAAVEQLWEQAGKALDRRVVAGLLSCLDNRGGRADWAHFGQR